METPGELFYQRTEEVVVFLFFRVVEVEIEICEREGRVGSTFTLDGFDNGRAGYLPLCKSIFIGHGQTYHNMLFPLPAVSFIRRKVTNHIKDCTPTNAMYPKK